MLWWRLQQLKSVNWTTRSQAAELLGESGNVRAVPPLIAALKDKDKNVREAVAYALGKLGDPIAVDPLLAALGDWNVGVRRAAVQSLGRLGDPRALNAVLEFLEDSDPDMRSVAAGAVEFLGRDRLEPEQRAVCAVARMKWEEAASIGAPAVPSLVAALEDSRNNVRMGALRALEQIGDQEAVEPLISLLVDPDTKIREAAAWALSEFADSRAVHPLISMAAGGGSVQVAVSALAQLVHRILPEMSTGDLKELARMADFTAGDRSPESSPSFSAPTGDVDCSRIRNLAKQELEKRAGNPGSPHDLHTGAMRRS